MMREVDAAARSIGLGHFPYVAFPPIALSSRKREPAARPAPLAVVSETTAPPPAPPPAPALTPAPPPKPAPVPRPAHSHTAAPFPRLQEIEARFGSAPSPRRRGASPGSRQ